MALGWRYFNGACYIVSGVAALALDFQASHASLAVLALGIAALLYGLYVVLTRRAYWVTTYAYLVPIILVGVAVAGR